MLHALRSKPPKNKDQSGLLFRDFRQLRFSVSRTKGNAESRYCIHTCIARCLPSSFTGGGGLRTQSELVEHDRDTAAPIDPAPGVTALCTYVETWPRAVSSRACRRVIFSLKIAAAL
jgi:hypothetical protein